MNQRQAAMVFVLVGLLTVGFAFLTAPTLASLLGVVEARSQGTEGSASAAGASSGAVDVQGPLGSALPRPAAADAAAGEIGAVDAETDFSPVVLQDLLQSFAPDVQACRRIWDDRAGPLPTALVVRLSLAPTGLEAAALEGVEAPEGFRSCLAALIWQTRWPAPAAATTLRYPLVWEEDAGATDAPGAGLDAPGDADNGGAP